MEVDWVIARFYAWLFGRVKDTTGMNLPGVGWAARRVHDEHVFNFAGQQVLFHPAVAGSYARMIAGEFNELSTYQFLLRAIEAAGHDVTFLEIGANVGEFLIPMAAHRGVRRAIGYEPLTACASVCVRSAKLNNLHKLELRASLVGDGTTHPFQMNCQNPNASAIGAGDPVQTVRIDDNMSELAAPLIMLVDVEGAEPLVLKGARHTIEKLSPLIIFEYNDVSRRHYKIDEIKTILGPRYTISRLRDDGSLDTQVERSWNCVAIASGSVFQKLCV